MTYCSCSFTLSQALAFVVATYLASTTLTEGCAPFNAAKITGMGTLGSGLLYSSTIGFMRFQLDPVSEENKFRNEAEMV